MNIASSATLLIRLMPEDIREWREARGWSRATLAAVLPTTERTVKSWELGTRKPPAYLWRALRDVERG